jgi:hypothetical protein
VEHARPLRLGLCHAARAVGDLATVCRWHPAAAAARSVGAYLLRVNVQCLSVCISLCASLLCFSLCASVCLCVADILYGAGAFQHEETRPLFTCLPERPERSSTRKIAGSQLIDTVCGLSVVSSKSRAEQAELRRATFQLLVDHAS